MGINHRAMEPIANLEAKTEFLKEGMMPHLRRLKPDATGQWGVLSAQQMVEHLADAFRNYSGLESATVVTPEDLLPRFREFMRSEKPFRPNTRNPVMSESPKELRFGSMEDALADLEAARDAFFAHFAGKPGTTLVNPIFGRMDFGEMVHMMDKHVRHHLAQFALL